MRTHVKVDTVKMFEDDEKNIKIGSDYFKTSARSEIHRGALRLLARDVNKHISYDKLRNEVNDLKELVKQNNDQIENLNFLIRTLFLKK